MTVFSHIGTHTQTHEILFYYERENECAHSSKATSAKWVQDRQLILP